MIGARYVDIKNLSCDLHRSRSKDAKRKHFGVFNVESWKHGGTGYLFLLSAYDMRYIREQGVELKSSEFVFRYETSTMLGNMRPFIKINLELKSPRVYFMTEEASHGDGKLEFEKRGVKIRWISIDESLENCLTDICRSHE